ncbi:unnamed protein product [Cylicocyclus nassatus]|uniref:Sushi domain-containing protein n=1 Tax=Cylicocyclus nassatus TaxID=53992 RepID=A0AA36LYQ3_CYLNA|nr:unnamed protein product [Cylicocyclus nassatus]
MGTKFAICKKGSWTPPSVGDCNPAAAHAPPKSPTQCFNPVTTVNNGVIKYSNDQQSGPWPQGSTASLMCNAGYLPKGPTISTCSGNGQFLPEALGPCVSTLQGDAPELPCPDLNVVGGTVTYSNGGSLPHLRGTRATLFCNLGYTLSGLPTVTCQEGKWSPSPGLGSCLMNTLQALPVAPVLVQHGVPAVGESCPTPVASPFGEITFSKSSQASGFPPGTTAALRCFMGRHITGPSFATCHRGVFRPPLGKCTDDRENGLPGVCLPLVPPANGRITYIQSGKLDNFEVGTTALLYCLESYAVTGQATAVCTKDGWQPSSGLGECDPVTRTF